MKYPFLNLNLKNKKAACSNATFSGGLNETPTEYALISYENISYKIIIKAVRNKISRLYIF